MLPLRWIAPRFPAALVVVVAGIALSSWLNLEQHGVAVVGEIPSGLPSLKFPAPPLNQGSPNPTAVSGNAERTAGCGPARPVVWGAPG